MGNRSVYIRKWTGKPIGHTSQKILLIRRLYVSSCSVIDVNFPLSAGRSPQFANCPTECITSARQHEKSTDIFPASERVNLTFPCKDNAIFLFFSLSHYYVPFTHKAILYPTQMSQKRNPSIQHATSPKHKATNSFNRCGHSCYDRLLSDTLRENRLLKTHRPKILIVAGSVPKTATMEVCRQSASRVSLKRLKNSRKVLVQTQCLLGIIHDARTILITRKILWLASDQPNVRMEHFQLHLLPGLSSQNRSIYLTCAKMLSPGKKERREM